MIGNTLLSVGAVFLFKGELVTVVKLTAARVYFTLPGDDNPRYVSYDTFLSRAEVPATCGTSTGRVSCESPNFTEVPKGSVAVDPSSGPDQAVMVTVDCGEVASITPVPSSPWKFEPDLKSFRAEGLDCLIIRHPSSGHLCGYVRLPSKSALSLRLSAYRRVPHPRVKATGELKFLNSLLSKFRRKVGYDHPVLKDVKVHGGLTFSGHIHHYKAKKGLWLGFDCAHMDDITPFRKVLPVRGSVYRDMIYVESQVRNLASQLRVLLGGCNA